MKSFIKIILNISIFSMLIWGLKIINHYDAICFFSACIITVLVVGLNEKIGDDKE